MVLCLGSGRPKVIGVLSGGYIEAKGAQNFYGGGSKGGGGKGVKPPPKYPSPDSKCIAGGCLSCWYDRLPAP